MGIKPTNISPYTLTTNSIIKATHKIIGQVTLSQLLLHPPSSINEANFILHEAVTMVMHTLHCTPNCSLGNYTPGALVFQCDMFLNLPLFTDIVTLTCSCQAQIDQSLLHIKAHHIPHEYKINKLNHFVMGPSIFFKSTPTIVSPSPMVQFLNALVSIILVHFTHHKLPLCGRMNTPS